MAKVKSLVINWTEPRNPWHPGGTFPRRPAPPALYHVLVVLVLILVIVIVS